MLLQEGGFTGTHLWLKSFLGLPQLINHCLVGVLRLHCSTSRQRATAATQSGAAAFPPSPGRLGRAEMDPTASPLRFS